MRLTIAALLLATSAHAADLYVPSEKSPTLFEAALLCESGDTIIVAGTASGSAFFNGVQDVTVVSYDDESEIVFQPGDRISVQGGSSVAFYSLLMRGGQPGASVHLINVSTGAELAMTDVRIMETTGRVLRVHDGGVATLDGCIIRDGLWTSGDLVVLSDESTARASLLFNAGPESGALVRGGTLTTCFIIWNTGAIGCADQLAITGSVLHENGAGVLRPLSMTGGVVSQNGRFGIDAEGVLAAIDDVTVTDNGMAAPWGFQVRATDCAVTNCTVAGCSPLVGTENDTEGSTFDDSDCPACRTYDVDDDGHVSFPDMVAVLAAWGTPAHDFDDDGTTSLGDLLRVLSAWGPCA